MIRILLIDDDEDDYVITAQYLKENIYGHYDVTWTSSFDEGREAILSEAYDVFLIDFYMGEHNGFELLQEGVSCGCSKPLILLTGAGDRDIDMHALELGAADFLVKGTFDAQVLERSIMYALRHRQTLNELQLSEERYRAVVESQHELICRFAPDTTLTFVNGAYADFFGQLPQDLIGEKWLLLLPEEERMSVREHLNKVIAKRLPVTYEHEVATRQGELHWQQWTDQPILDSQGNVQEIQSVGVDITIRKKTEIALNEALEQERELGELKSRFVSMASHEFRTPLTTIMSTASYLKMADAQITPEKREARLQKIMRTVMSMTDLLNDVLLFGKGNAGRLEINPQWLDLHRFCEEIVEDMRAVAASHEIIFESHMDHAMMAVDEKLMRQIINNLMTNAVKYSPNSTQVTLTLTDTNEEVRISVKDSGIGIPSADQARLFEPFHRAKNVGQISGTGLGLAITKNAVELHGGFIHVDSEQNKGTTFTIIIPRVAITEEGI